MCRITIGKEVLRKQSAACLHRGECVSREEGRESQGKFGILPHSAVLFLPARLHIHIHACTAADDTHPHHVINPFFLQKEWFYDVAGCVEDDRRHFKMSFDGHLHKTKLSKPPESLRKPPSRVSAFISRGGQSGKCLSSYAAVGGAFPPLPLPLLIAPRPLVVILRRRKSSRGDSCWRRTN